MSNSGSYIVRLGDDPETIKLGSIEGRKLRCADNTFGKKSVTRWFNAIVTGRDVETADRLRKGNRIVVSGQLVLEEYAPKKPRYRGEKVKTDVMPFAKITEVIESETYFGNAEQQEGEGGDPAEAGVVETEAPDLTGEGAIEDPLANV
jgi:single-stranded DNA-binding protein